METKGATIAVHYRATPDAISAGRTLEQRMGALAVPAKMALISGKHVVELVPAGFPLKEGGSNASSRAMSSAPRCTRATTSPTCWRSRRSIVLARTDASNTW